MIVRPILAVAVALLLLVRPCEASCEEISWDLRDALRELVLARVGQAGPLAASQVDARLRGRGLPFTKPIFRFARGTNLARVAVGEQPHDLAPCEVSEVFHDVPSPEGPTSVAAALRVESAVLAFDAEEEPASWHVVARVREEVPLEAFEIVVGAQRGAARRHALRREGRTLRATVPRGALEGPVTMQIVAQTPLGPEVVAELRTVPTTAAPEAAAPLAEARAASLLEALNAARANLGVPKLQEDAALQRFAERTLAAALNRGLLSHRTPEGLVAERLKAAHISTRRAGELLARIAAGEPPAERFLASPAHRVIMGDPKLRSVGVAEGNGPDGLRWIVVVLTSP